MDIAKVLGHSGIYIKGYLRGKTRPYVIDGAKLDIKMLFKRVDAIRARIFEAFPDPEVVMAFSSQSRFEEALQSYCEKTWPAPNQPDGILGKLKIWRDPEVVEDRAYYTVNMETMQKTSIRAQYLKDVDFPDMPIASVADTATQRYLPHDPPGFSEVEMAGMPVTVFNSYVRPLWRDFPDEVPDELPPVVRKLVDHIFPNPLERDFFWHWLHNSMFDRAMTYLVLCGAPGVGKNRLKMLFTALHGIDNAVDGKKSGLERFNSQVKDATLLWFDELRFNEKNVNALKEIPNESLAIELKGVDQTRRTKIYISPVICNNLLRDNYITFEDRKFVPLELSPNRLETALTNKEIEEFNRMFDAENPDKVAVTQVARWIEKHGYDPRWPICEYRGPMFYRLANTSMGRWKRSLITHLKKLDVFALNPNGRKHIKTVVNGRYLYSEVESYINGLRRSGGKTGEPPEYTTVRSLLNYYRDVHGRRRFKTYDTEWASEDVTNDFFIEVIKEKDLEQPILAYAPEPKETEEPIEELELEPWQIL